MIRISILLASLLVCTNVYAQPVQPAETEVKEEKKEDAVSVSKLLEKVPPLKQGIAYSTIDSQINYLSTIEVAKLNKDTINVEVGYAGRAKNTRDKLVAVLSTNILNLEKKGVNLPIAKYIDVNVGLYAGWGNINGQGLQDAEFDYGVSATVLKLKW